jgi:4'-phosphopantetheinyl transferase EntD
LEHVSLPEERAWLASADAPGLHLDKVLFCSKEATYKAWFPLASRWLGFEDAHIAFEIDARPLSFADGRQAVASGSFHTKLLVDGSTLSGSPLTTFDGRWLIADGLVLTAIAHR